MTLWEPWCSWGFLPERLAGSAFNTFMHFMVFVCHKVLLAVFGFVTLMRLVYLGVDACMSFCVWI